MDLPSCTMPAERQITTNPHGHIITNTAVWSPDSHRIVYDVRSDPAGNKFDGQRIETVDVETGEIRLLYEARNGASCGVATYHPQDNKVIFILGPERPTPEWQYEPAHRQGVIVQEVRPQYALLLDARDLTPPFRPGALRGGSHVHIFSGDGQWVSFTYEDHVLLQHRAENGHCEINLRSVGISVPAGPVHVNVAHPRNHDGSHFSVLVTKTTAHPTPGSDEIMKAFEDAWVGVNGYLHADGRRQRRALAFQGHVLDVKGNTLAEAFVVDIPDDVTVTGDGPLEGTITHRPRPPRGTVQRRLTHTADRRYPGLQGPRHWLRSSPDGSRIAILMRDDTGVVQLWTISPLGGAPVKVTSNPWSIASAFSWSPDGRWIAHVMDKSVCATEVGTGVTTRLTARSSDAAVPRPEACVFSPDGAKIAYVRTVGVGENRYNQIFKCDLSSD